MIPRTPGGIGGGKIKQLYIEHIDVYTEKDDGEAERQNEGLCVYLCYVCIWSSNTG